MLSLCLSLCSPKPSVFTLLVCVSVCARARACILSDIVSLPDLSGRASRSSQLTDSLFVRVSLYGHRNVFFPLLFCRPVPAVFYDFVSLLISSLRLVACFFLHPHAYR